MTNESAKPNDAGGVSELPISVVTRHEVEYRDLEQFVNNVYGIPPQSEYDRGYSFVATEECGNDSSHSFTVHAEEFNEWFDKERFLASGYARYANGDILNDLCHKGLIPAGDYIVHVCW